MSLKITPEIEASMCETEAQIEADMRDPSFRAEYEATDLRYKLFEAFQALLKKAASTRKFAALPKRQRLTFALAFGGGKPVEIENESMALC